MLRKFYKLVCKIAPHIRLVDYSIVFIQSLFFHKSFTYMFKNGLNSYLLNEKIKSDNLSSYVDKITAKDFINKFDGAKTPKTISIVENSKIIIPKGNWIFKASHDASGGIIFNNGKLSDAKRKILSTSIDNPSLETIIDILNKFISFTKDQNHFYETRESCYKSLTPKYFFEKLLIDKLGNPLNDLKIHVINGKFQFAYIVIDRLGKNKRAIVDKDFNNTGMTWCKPRDLYKYNSVEELIAPNFWEELINIAEEIGKHFKYLRVDFFVDEDKFYIGELTFFHGSGLEKLLPSEKDYYYGSLIAKNNLNS